MLNAILTLGPASDHEEVIRALLDVANAFRLNASHLSPEGLRWWLSRIARVFADAGREVPVYVDLQGAKMRIGRYPACERIPSEIRFVLGTESTDAGRIPVPHEAFFGAVQPGDTVTMNDARVELVIVSAHASSVEARVVRNGPLSSHKGINRVHHPLPCPTLGEADRRAVEAALAWPFTRFAFSFVHEGCEASLVRPLVGARPVAAKIERPEAFACLDAIAERFDELWLCRGDLGAQAGLSALGSLQDEFARRCRSLGKPFYLAGQVLEHMTHFPEPTRAEVVGLHAAEREGFCGVVLSDETAVGRNVLEVARFLRSVAVCRSTAPPETSAPGQGERTG